MKLEKSHLSVSVVFRLYEGSSGLWDGFLYGSKLNYRVELAETKNPNVYN